MAYRYAGIDWAAEKHDVLVADEAVRRCWRRRIAHDEKGLTGAVPHARAAGGGAGRDRAAGRAVGRAAAWMPGCGCWRCIRIRSRRRATGSGSRAGSPIGLTRSCSASSRGPTSPLPGARARQRSDEGDPGADPRARGFGQDPDRGDEPAARGARAVLARTAAAVQPYGRGDPARVLGALPQPGGCPWSGVARMQAFLVRERYSGGQHPTALMAKLRSAPRARIGELELAARRQLVLGFVAMISTLNAQIKNLERRDPCPVRAHPDGRSSCRCSNRRRASSPPLSCSPRSATAASATPPATRSPPTPAKPRSRSSPANGRPPASAGVQQATTRRVLPPGGHQPPLAPPGPDLYAQARQRGHEHPRAIRTVGRAWCRVVWQCWRNHTPYDPRVTARCNATSP